MRQISRDCELELLISSSTSEAMEYVTKCGIHPQNQIVLFNEKRQVFDALAPKCKRLSQEVLCRLIKEGSLAQVMTRCLSEENQRKLVQMYPEKVQEYLTTLEKHLDQGRGAYLAPRAEEEYLKLCEVNDQLPKIRRFFTKASTGNSPFEGLASLLS